MDISSIVGVVLALAGIIAGLMIEGGNLKQIMQPTALMIVLGGTIGAVMLQFPLNVVLAAFKRLMSVFFGKTADGSGVVKQMVGFANKARKDGVVSLDSELAAVKDPFLKQALTLAVDGTDANELRTIMQLELDNHSEKQGRIPQVFESAGGFAPTIGILGAVLGLIQVMGHLDDIHEVGRGIAVAFVATIYGVGFANLLFLPSAGKLKIRNQQEEAVRMMALEGVTSILEGMNPRMLEVKLSTFLDDQKKKGAKGEAAQA